MAQSNCLYMILELYTPCSNINSAHSSCKIHTFLTYFQIFIVTCIAFFVIQQCSYNL